MKPSLACAIFLTVLVSCSTESNAPGPTGAGGPSAPDSTLPQTFSVSSAYVFVPQWEGATGFSAGGKYVIQGEQFGEDRTHLSGGVRLLGLPEDGSPVVAFTVVGASLKADHIEVQTTGSEGQQYTGEGTTLWLVHDDTQSAWFDLSKGRLLKALDGGHRPHGEGEHALHVAIDLNGDGKPDYAEFSHYCKAEQAPYPLDEQGRTAWTQEHGDIDWDATCRNTFTIRAGVWEKDGRKAPK